MAARLEKIAARLGRAIVASSAFAERLPGEFAALGAFELAGFRSAQTVFGVREEGMFGGWGLRAAGRRWFHNGAYAASLGYTSKNGLAMKFRAIGVATRWA